jgi:hypothetical protein
MSSIRLLFFKTTTIVTIIITTSLQLPANLWQLFQIAFFRAWVSDVCLVYACHVSMFTCDIFLITSHGYLFRTLYDFWTLSITYFQICMQEASQFTKLHCNNYVTFFWKKVRVLNWSSFCWIQYDINSKENNSNHPVVKGSKTCPCTSYKSGVVFDIRHSLCFNFQNPLWIKSNSHFVY